MIIVQSDMTACIGDFGLALQFRPGEVVGDTHGQVSQPNRSTNENALSFDNQADEPMTTHFFDNQADQQISELFLHLLLNC